MANAGKPELLWEGHAEVTDNNGLVRVDLLVSDVEEDGSITKRFCQVMDVRAAQSLAILLIRSIEKAEIFNSKRKK